MIRRLIILLLIVGCGDETEILPTLLSGYCHDINASNCRTNNSNNHHWCDSTQTQFDSLVVLGEIEGGDIIDCEYCIDILPQEECCGREDALNFQMNHIASYWDTLYCIYP